MGRGQRQFHTANPATNHHHTGMGQSHGHKRLPSAGIIAQGLGRAGEIGKSHQIGQVRCDPDVEACKIIGQGRPTLQDHGLRIAVDANGTVQNQPGTGKAGQTDKVDHDIGALIMPCDQAGQHAGIGGYRIGVDQCQTHARQGLHRPHPRHQGMGMPAADQHKVAYQGQVWVLHGDVVLGLGHPIPLRANMKAGDGRAIVRPYP